MMKFIHIIVISILLISCSILSWFYFQERNKFDIYKIKSVQEVNHLKAVNEGLKGAFLESQINNNLKIAFPDEQSLPEFTFCLFISENQCSSCVNAMLKYYTENFNIIPDSNIIILANFSSNALKHLKVKHQLKCRIISTYGTKLTIAENKYPCFFIYDKMNTEIEMFLFPLKNEPEMITKYFENVRDKYFAQENNI